MSRRIPVLAGRERPANLAVLMREAFVAINDLVIARLAERGHGDVRPAHAAVFQYLDDTGTTVSVLAERAQMTKQAMAELVRHLEERGYLVRVPDPTDKRAKLVLPTDRGRDVIAVAQALVPELEKLVTDLLGADRVLALRADLDTIRRAITAVGAGVGSGPRLTGQPVRRRPVIGSLQMPFLVGTRPSARGRVQRSPVRWASKRAIESNVRWQLPQCARSSPAQSAAHPPQVMWNRCRSSATPAG